MVNSELNQTRILELDGLRGVAIILVLLYNIGQLTAYEGDNSIILAFFSLVISVGAVLIFFLSFPVF